MIFQSILLFTSLVGAMALVLNIAGANLYDLRYIRQRRQQQQHPYARQYRRRPLVTVIIPTSNDETRIVPTLQSVSQSLYRKLEIIIVDQNSHDNTKYAVRQFVAAHPYKNIRLSAKRQPKLTVEAVADMYRKYAQGELIVWLQPGQLLDRQALTNAVRRFNAEPGLGGLRCARRVKVVTSSVSLFQRFEMLLSSRSRKYSSASNTDYAPVADGVIYSRQALGQLLQTTSRKATALTPLLSWLQLGNRVMRLGYGHDTVIYSPPLGSWFGLFRQRYQLQLHRMQLLGDYRRLFFTRSPAYSKLLTWFRLPLAVCVGIAALLLPILLTYVGYLAFRLHQPALYALSWVFLTGFTLFAIWEDEQLRQYQKASYSVLAPAVQGVFYLLSFVQIAVVVRAASSKLASYSSAKLW